MYVKARTVDVVDAYSGHCYGMYREEGMDDEGNDWVTVMKTTLNTNDYRMTATFGISV